MQFPFMHTSRSRAHYRSQISAIVLITLMAFLILSLFSYHPEDPSWFYHSTESSDIGNWCGRIGAQIAAFLFYLCGSSSLLIIPALWFGAYHGLRHTAFSQEWERYLFWPILLLVCAALSNFHQISSFGESIPGGCAGSWLCSAMRSSFDVVGAALFLYALLGICIVLLTRFSFMHGALRIWHAIKRVVGYLVEYRVVQRLAMAIYTTAFRFAQTISYPFSLFGAFVVSLIDGSLFEGTTLAQPADEDEQMPLGVSEKEETFSAAHIAQQRVEPDRIVPVMEKQIITPVVPPAARAVSAPSYRLPQASLFSSSKKEADHTLLDEELNERAQLLQDKLKRFGIQGEVVSIKRGPVVTLFEYKPHIDTKISKILALEDDLALALQAMSIRILAPIPGTSVVGFEVANKNRHDVLFSTIVRSKEYTHAAYDLPLVLGSNTAGGTVIVDLVRMPHLLIAGSTGSGKSIALNVMLMSLLCKRTPDEMRLVLIDPKRLEFSAYADIAHLLFPIVTDPYKVSPILQWVVQQMEDRYEKMAARGVRSMHDYNSQISAEGGERFPFIVVVIDELADLMMTVGREIEDLIARIAQMARAAGIHLMVATQRPSVDVITGLIKVNFPSRVSFRVTSRIDSRTILDTGGAEKLLGRGDMLFLDSTTSMLKRVHGAYVSTAEIASIVGHIRAERQVEYHELPTYTSGGNGAATSAEDEQLYEQVVLFLQEVDHVSISLIQRKFRIGFNRSGRMIEMLEARGNILPADGGKMRRVVK